MVGLAFTIPRWGCLLSHGGGGQKTISSKFVQRYVQSDIAQFLYRSKNEQRYVRADIAQNLNTTESAHIVRSIDYGAPQWIPQNVRPCSEKCYRMALPRVTLLPIVTRLKSKAKSQGPVFIAFLFLACLVHCLLCYRVKGNGKNLKRDQRMFKSIFEIEYEDFSNYETAAKESVNFDKIFAVYNALDDAGLADTKEAQHLANILQI